MSLSARLSQGAGLLILGGILLSGGLALGADEPPLSKQLTDLGRQALAQGAAPTAQTFFQKALQLDPTNQDAARGLAESKKRGRDSVVRVALQEPGEAQAPPAGAMAPPAPPAPAPPDQPAPAADTRATLEQHEAAEHLVRQQLTNDVEQRLQAARELMTAGQPEAALNALRLAQNVVRSATNVSEADRLRLDRRVQAQFLSAVQAE